MLLNDGENGSQKVELVINQQGNEGYEISLINVFKNMGETASLFVRIICLFLIIGMIASMGMSYINKDRGYAQATAVLTYQQLVEDEPDEEDEEELLDEPTYHLDGPDEMVFGTNIYSAAIKNANLSDLITADSISGNVSIQRNLTDESSQALEVIQNAVAAGKAASAELLELELEYSDKYVVTIKNGFKKDANSKPVYLTGGQLGNLLDAILDAYEEYLYKTKADTVLPDKFFEIEDLEGLDYMQSLTILRDGLNSFKEYFTQKALEYPEYRSPKSGLSFEELVKLLEISKTSEVDYLYSYVYCNNVSRDPEALLTNYNYDIRQKTLKLDGLDHIISSNEKIIKNYKNEHILFAVGEEIDKQESIINTDYYNKIFIEQAELYKERAALQSEIDDLKSIAKNLSAAFAIENIDEEMSKVLKKTEEIENFAYDFAKEFTSSDVIKASFANCSSARYAAQSFINAGSIKSAVIAGVVGAFLAVCIWAVYAFVIEIKKEEKKHEVVQ